MLSTPFLPLLQAKCHFSPAFLINSLPTLIVTSTHKISVAASGFPLGCHAIGLFVIVWGSARRGVTRQKGRASLSRLFDINTDDLFLPILRV